jgi:hypothetical protein
MINKTVYFDYDGLYGKGIVIKNKEHNLYTLRLIGDLEGLGHDCGGEYDRYNYWNVPRNRCQITDNKIVKGGKHDEYYEW